MNYTDTQRLKNGVRQIMLDTEYWMHRGRSQISFAENLCELQKTKAAAFTKLIAQAKTLIDKAVATGSTEKLAAAVTEAETLLAPVGKAAKEYTMHMVGHAHIDMNWMWSWPETVATTNDTFTTVLKLMDEFPEFTFSQSQASVYQIAKQYNPELFEAIKRRVAEGRWEVTAAHWVEGDKNLASGESLTRHLLYTRQFFAENFGMSPESAPTDWEPDTFGHAATIPMIVSRGAVKYYYMCRGGDAKKPAIFWWKGPDGSRILVNIETTWYNDILGPNNTAGMINFLKRVPAARDWLCVYGVGDHGGGPTRRDIVWAIDMATWPIFPTVKFSTTTAYYKKIEQMGDKLPTLEGELNFEFTGCYTSQTTIKKANRLGETHLVDAEAAAVLGLRLADITYPTDTLRQGWIDTIFGHFHDILPGSGVDATRHYQMGLCQKVLADTHMIKTLSYRKIAASIDTSFAKSPEGVFISRSPKAQTRQLGAGMGRDTWFGEMSQLGVVVDGARPFVAFNPTAWPRTTTIKVSVWDNGQWEQYENKPWHPATESTDKLWLVRGSNGETIPAQKIGEGDFWGHQYIDLAVPVTVPAFGWTAVSIEPGCVDGYVGKVTTDAYYYEYAARLVGDTTIRNEFLEVDVDPNTGGICKLVDRATGKGVVDPASPAAIMEYVFERPGPMTAWVIHDPQEVITPKVSAVNVRQRGPHFGQIEVIAKVKSSDIKINYIVRAGCPWVEIDVEVLWTEVGSPATGVPSLRMSVPLTVKDASGIYESPFGTIERAANARQEVPTQRFADVVGKDGTGCVVVNDSKYGCTLAGSTLTVSMIRSTYDPDPLPEVRKHKIRFGLAPHGKRLKSSDLVRMGVEFNHPLQIVATDVHAGKLASTSAAAITCSAANVIVVAVKKAEGDNSLIVRLSEVDGKATVATVTFDAKTIGKVATADEVDLIERTLEKVGEKSSAKVQGNGFTVKVPAKGIASVKVKLK